MRIEVGEPKLRFTIEVEGWDQLRVVAPIAEYIHLLDHCRDEDGVIDDIGVVCALDTAMDAVMKLLGSITFGLSQVPKNEVILESEPWPYIHEQMAELIEAIKEIGPTRIRGADGANSAAGQV